MTDLTDDVLDKLVARLTWAAGIDQAEYPFPLCDEAAEVITALRQREAEAVAGAIEAASGIAMGFHTRALEWAKSVRGLDKYVGETDSYRIAAAIRAMHTDATSAALDRAKAEGMREAARRVVELEAANASLQYALAQHGINGSKGLME